MNETSKSVITSIMASALCAVAVFSHCGQAFAEEAVPGTMLDGDGYLRVHRLGLADPVRELVYRPDGSYAVKFKDFEPSDVGFEIDADGSVQSAELRFKAMLETLSWNGNGRGNSKLRAAMSENGGLFARLYPVIKMNESSSETRNPDNGQGLFQMYDYYNYFRWGCLDGDVYYGKCSEASKLYAPWKEVSEAEYFEQLADFVLFLQRKVKVADGIAWNQGPKSELDNLRFVFVQLGENLSENDASGLYGALEMSDFSVRQAEFVKAYSSYPWVSKVASSPEELAKFVQGMKFSTYLLAYNGFRFGSFYWDNPYVASIRYPENGAPRICMVQCANDGCSKRNVKNGNGALFNYAKLSWDSKFFSVFSNVMEYMSDRWKLINQVPCP